MNFKILSVFLIFSCCSLNKQTEKVIKRDEINEKIAIYYVPNEREVDSLIISIGEDSYNEVLDDNVNYFNEIIEYLDSLGINVKISNENSFLFESLNGDSFLINRHLLKSPLWGILYFNGNTEPKLLDISNYRNLVP